MRTTASYSRRAVVELRKYQKLKIRSNSRDEKYLFLLLPVIAILLMSIGVSAKSKCEVVSDAGKNIGDEITCGGEHFYAVDSGANETKMQKLIRLLPKAATVKRRIFISSLMRKGGAVCGSYASFKTLSGRSCYFVAQMVLPAGIRPMVTFDNADINFRFTIKTKRTATVRLRRKIAPRATK